MSISKKEKMGFGFYDFSNSGFVIVFQSVLFPLVLSSAASGVIKNADSVWAWLVAGSSLLAVLAAPFVGVIADVKGRSKLFSLLVCATGILAAAVSFFLSKNIFGLIIGFLVFNALFELSQSVYNSFLRRLTAGIQEGTTLSSFGWGVGYLGSALFAALYFIGEKMGIPKDSSLAIFALLFILVSIPAMRFFRSRDAQLRSQDEPILKIHRPRAPIPWTQLLIYWVIADCVAALLYFVPLYAQNEIGVGTKTFGALMLGALLLAFPLTIFMGKLANRFGHVRMIRIGLVLWFVALAGLFFARSATALALVMIPFAFVVGSTQAIMRAHFAARIERETASEGFGFYALAEKSASVLSPVLVGVVITVTGVVRPAFAVLAVLMAIAFLLSSRLPKVPEQS